MAWFDFLLQHKFVVLFYLAVFFFVLINRKKFDFVLKVIALYRTEWGKSLMDRISSRFREPVKLFGYISIGLGFAGMAFIMFALAQGLYALFTVPNAPPALAPILPGVRVPGVPDSLFVPLVKGIIAIFIVAVVHEFAHGVVARAHNVTVKKTGIAIVGPFFAAFVEPEEREMKKRDDVTNYSIIAAGSVTNFVLFVLLSLIISAVFAPLVNLAYPPSGVSFSSIAQGSPAQAAGLEADVLYTVVDGKNITSASEFLAAFGGVKPNETVTMGNAASLLAVQASAHPQDPDKPYLGVNIYTRHRGDETPVFKSLSWILQLLSLTALLSIGIGLANLLPIVPLDGGKMLQVALHRMRGENRGNQVLVRISLILLFVIIILLTPIFRATAGAVFG